MSEWFTVAQLGEARLPGLSARTIKRLAVGWRADEKKVRRASGRGGGFEYHISVLPPAAQSRLLIQSNASVSRETSKANDNSARSKALWDRFGRLSKKHKDECARRLAALERIDTLRASGFSETSAIAVTSREKKIAPATLWRWLDLVAGVPRADWLAALAPQYKATAAFADCHPDAWRAFTSDYLRPERPGLSACYRRLIDAAAERGWTPIPSERALRRRLGAEVAAGTLVIAREGADAAKKLYPAQRRSRAALSAMSAVNTDGHKFDVFVRFDDGRIGRPLLVALQDVYSGKMLAWRHAETENKVAVRLAIGDMVERFGIPDAIYLDNGRAFASKWITGGAPTRFRFKVREEDPQGLLVTLGVEVHWTTPYSGQSKPIERAFRDLCEDIAKHPFCAGAYTGNSPEAKPESYGARAIPFEEFKVFADRMIAEHNARAGRRSETAKGRSFDETFAASMETAIVRWPSKAQRHLWLLAAERVSARKGSGEIHLAGNRYWSRELNAWAGRKVAVRFDPDALHQSIKVYGPDDAFICEAPCVEDAGFASSEAARDHARKRRDYMRSLRESEGIRERMSAAALADLYAGGAPKPAPVETPAGARGPIKQIAVAGRRAPEQSQQRAEFDEGAFERGLRLISGGG